MGLRRSADGLRRRFCNSLSRPVTIRHRSNYCQKPLKMCTTSNIPRNSSSFSAHFSSFFLVFSRFLLILRTNAHARTQKHPCNDQKLQQTPCFLEHDYIWQLLVASSWLTEASHSSRCEEMCLGATRIYRRLRYLGRSGLLGRAHRPVPSFCACFIRPLNSLILGCRNRGSAYPWPVSMSRALKSRPSGR
jgi:hypothetical protein